tara:strand:+ start:2135 stop:4906 length:2772 start_codon:yes stop_codon:yes gene_type:complete
MYNSYAETKGFDPVNIPDPGKKIREQGVEALRGMERELAENVRQSDRIVNALENNARVEKENANLNHQLRRGYADKLAGAKWKQFETLINNEGVKAKQHQKDWESLLNITDSGAKVAKAWHTKRDKDANNYAKDLKEQHGIGWKKYDAVRQIEDHIFNEESSRQAALAELELDGVPLDVIHRIRNNGAFRGLRVAKQSAIALARNLPNIYEEYQDHEFDLGGDGEGIKVTLNASNSEQLTEILRLIRREKRDEFGERWPSANIWETSGAWEIAEKADAAYIKARVKKEEQGNINKFDRDEANVFSGFLDQAKGDSGQAAQLFLKHYTGPEGGRYQNQRAKKKLVRGFSYALQNGLIDIDRIDLNDLENLEMEVKGQAGKVKFGHYFKEEFFQIEQAYNKAATERDKISGAQAHLRNAHDNEMLNEVVRLEKTEDMNTEEWINLLKSAEKNNLTKTATHITGRLSTHRTTINDAEGTAALFARAERNEVITDNDIKDWNFSEETDRLVRAEVNKRNRLLPQRGEDGTLEKLKYRITEELNLIIPKNNLGAGNATRKDAELAALSEASGLYRDYRVQGLSHEASYEKTVDIITQRIKNPDGEYRAGEIQPDGTREFWKWQADSTATHVRPDEKKLLEDLSANPGNIFTQQYISLPEVISISATANRGLNPKLPPMAMEVQRLTRGKISAIDFMVAQTQRAIDAEIKLKGSSNIQPLPENYTKRFSDEIQKISPNVRRLLNTLNFVDVNKAAASPKEDGSMSNIPYQKPIYDKVRSIARKPYNNDYNSIGPGVNSIDTYDFTLTGGTFREILQLFENGSIEAAGAYGFTSDQLKSAAEAGGIPYTTRFNKDNQDKLFEILYRSKQYHPIQVDSEIDQMILDDTQNMEQEDSDSNAGFYRVSWLRPEATTYMLENGFPIGGTAYATA